MEVSRFHVVVIGSGPAGSSAAIRLAKAGLSVAIVDEREYGGTCPNRGCDPKLLIRSGAEIAHRTRSLAPEGIVEPASIAWDRLVAFKRRYTEQVPRSVEASLSQARISVIHGRATFTDPRTVRVGAIALTAERFIIATGAKPKKLAFPGAEHLATSDDVLDFDELPEHALFVGGGYVSFELAHLLNACGVVCTIVHKDDAPLRTFDQALVRMLIESSRQDGIDVVLNAEVIGVEPVGSGFHVHVSSEGEHHTYETDVAVHGAGREANIDTLSLTLAGVHPSREGIAVDRYLRAREHIYAIGDCTSLGTATTPLAQLQGRIVAETLIGRPTAYEDEIVPRAIFTLPELATVGMTQEAARSEGIEVNVENHETSTWFSSMRIGQHHSGARILIDPTSDLIVGAHLLSEGSADVINLFALAMREGISARSLKELITVFPTHSSDIANLL